MKFSLSPKQIIARKRLISILLVVLTCALAVRPANAAAPIQGEIDFGGVVTYNTTSLATATQVTQWNNSIVLQRTGDFANPTYSIDPGDPATMTAPWTFNSGTPGTPAPGPALNALWSIGGFTFDLSSSMVASQNSTFLDVEGTGTISGNGFDPTPGTWSFTSTKSDGGTSNSFGFQAQSAAVPEPSSILLLMTGTVITACHLSWKRKKRAAVR
jgi:hypothetical protein